SATAAANPHNYTITMGGTTASPTYTVTDNSVTPPSTGTPQAYQAGSPTTLTAGVTVAVSGTPSAGDTFTVAPNSGGTNDGSNALALSKLVNAKSFGNGTTTLTGAYANYVNGIGNTTSQLKSSSAAQTALVGQITSAQQSVSGVNQNEEAANLMQYQQLYQANAKVIQTAATLFQTVLGLFN
ncbi:flagellar basal body rod C-terminal domain-containing protein, partial [Burkholderia sp. LMG 13014]|uniref:flagellar basal body rod C-terminal domain-containing protein n=1 Tax=Burkholderia sp. LMG 13014 TaxID=2709306 RepID=UPI0023DD058F